jgi:hypothetical protein
MAVVTRANHDPNLTTFGASCWGSARKRASLVHFSSMYVMATYGRDPSLIMHVMFNVWQGVGRPMCAHTRLASNHVLAAFSQRLRAEVRLRNVLDAKNISPF